MKTLSKRHWWSFTFCLGLLAVAYLRVAGAEEIGTINWTRQQSHDLAVAALDSPIRYVCVNDTAYDLGQQGPINLMEDRLVLDHNAARSKCTLPFIPHPNSGKILMVATSPKSGYGAIFMSFNQTQNEALDGLSQQLEQIGWQRQFAPKHNGVAHKGRMFERDESWIFTVATSFSPIDRETKILLAGNFDPDLMR